MSRTVGYDYDAYGRRSKLTWPDGGNVTYTYDNAGALTGIFRSPGALVQFANDAEGRLRSIGRANGAHTYFWYDGLSRLTQVQQGMTGTGDFVAPYAYNPASQLKSRTSTSSLYEPAAPTPGARPYEANSLNQMTKSGTYTLGYDLRGNTRSDGVNGYRYDAENRMTALYDPGTTTDLWNLSYDAQGRLAKITMARRRRSSCTTASI